MERNLSSPVCWRRLRAIPNSKSAAIRATCRRRTDSYGAVAEVRDCRDAEAIQGGEYACGLSSTSALATSRPNTLATAAWAADRTGTLYLSSCASNRLLRDWILGRGSPPLLAMAARAWRRARLGERCAAAREKRHGVTVDDGTRQPSSAHSRTRRRPCCRIGFRSG